MALGVGAYCLVLRRYGFELADEGTLLAQMDRVAHGQVPYRDFHTGYGPALFYGHAALFQAAGTSVGTVRAGLAVVHAVRAGLAASLAERAGARGWTAVVALLLVGFFLPVAPGVCCPFLVPYAAWYADAAGIVAVCLLVRRDAVGAAAGAGILWGAAFAFKQTTGLLGLAGAMVGTVLATPAPRASAAGRLVATAVAAGLLAGTWVLLHEALDGTLALAMGLPIVVLAVATARARPGAPEVARVLALGAGFLAVALPLVLAMTARAGGAAVATDLLQLGTDTARVYYVGYPSPAALVARATGALTVRGAVRELADGAWFLLFPAVHLLAAAALVARRLGGRAATIVAAAATVGFLALYPRMDFWHVLGIAPVSLAALAIVAGLAPPAARGLVAAGFVAAALVRALPIVPVLATLATPDAGPHLDRVDLRWDLVTPPALAAIPRVVEAVADKRRVAGFPATGVVNFALGRPSPWRHDYFFPGRPDAGEEAALVATLERDPPDAVVVLASDDAFSAPAFAAHAPLVAAIERRCREAQTIGPYRILVPEPAP